MGSFGREGAKIGQRWARSNGKRNNSRWHSHVAARRTATASRSPQQRISCQKRSHSDHRVPFPWQMFVRLRSNSTTALTLCAALMACRGSRDADASKADTTSLAPSTPASAPPAAPLPGIPPAFSVAQATRGEKVYTTVCARCHITDRFSGATFETQWKNRRVYDLLEIISSTMPQDAPGTLTTQQYVDVVAYLLKLNGAQGGGQPLGSDGDAIKKMRIGITQPTE